MRLIPRHKHHRSVAQRISISQAEITADLHYPAIRQSVGDNVATPPGRGKR